MGLMNSMTGTYDIKTTIYSFKAIIVFIIISVVFIISISYIVHD